MASGTKIYISSDAPKREGYRFIGWASSQARADEGKKDYSTSSFFILTSDITIYAAWKEDASGQKDVTLTYDPNDGTGGPGSVTVPIGNMIGISAEHPSREGYTFQGWASSKTRADAVVVDYTASTTPFKIKSNMTIYAVWSSEEHCTITFFPNADYVSGCPDPIYVTKGTVITFNTIPSRVGFTFQGWSENPYMATPDYFCNGNLIVTSDVALYAVWKELPPSVRSCTLTYNLNGGKDGPEPVEVPSGSKIGIVDQQPTREGYMFAGWSSTEARADAAVVDYRSGYIFDIDADISIYAAWVIAPAIVSGDVDILSDLPNNGKGNGKILTTTIHITGQPNTEYNVLVPGDVCWMMTQNSYRNGMGNYMTEAVTTNASGEGSFTLLYYSCADYLANQYREGRLILSLPASDVSGSIGMSQRYTVRQFGYEENGFRLLNNDTDLIAPWMGNSAPEGLATRRYQDPQTGGDVYEYAYFVAGLGGTCTFEIIDEMIMMPSDSPNPTEKLPWDYSVDGGIGWISTQKDQANKQIHLEISDYRLHFYKNQRGQYVEYGEDSDKSLEREVYLNITVGKDIYRIKIFQRPLYFGGKYKLLAEVLTRYENQIKDAGLYSYFTGMEKTGTGIEDILVKSVNGLTIAVRSYNVGEWYYVDYIIYRSGLIDPDTYAGGLPVNPNPVSQDPPSIYYIEVLDSYGLMLDLNAGSASVSALDLNGLYMNGKLTDAEERERLIEIQGFRKYIFDPITQILEPVIFMATAGGSMSDDIVEYALTFLYGHLVDVIDEELSKDPNISAESIVQLLKLPLKGLDAYGLVKGIMEGTTKLETFMSTVENITNIGDIILWVMEKDVSGKMLTILNEYWEITNISQNGMTVHEYAFPPGTCMVKGDKFALAAYGKDVVFNVMIAYGGCGETDRYLN